MKRTLLVFLFSPALILYGQRIEPSVIGALGAYESIGRYELSYTLGETFISTLEMEQRALTQGFQQPEWLTSVSISQEIPNAWQIKVYPSPVERWLNLDVSQVQMGVFTAQIFDMRGRQVMNSQEIRGREKTQWDISTLSKGIYTLVLEDEQQRTAVWKIMKTTY